MSVLIKSELDFLDNRIDEFIPSLSYLKIDRITAILHLLRYFEDCVRLYQLRYSDFGEKASYIKKCQDGVHYAVIWINKYCNSSNVSANFDTNDKVYILTHDFLEYAICYSNIWDLLSMAHRGRAKVEKTDENQYLFYPNEISKYDFDCADHIISAPDSPESEVIYKDIMTNFNEFELISNIDFKIVNKNKIKYRVPNHIYRPFYDAVSHCLSNLWELDPTWDLGGYTINDFKLFWFTITSLSRIHLSLCSYSGIEGGALNSILKYKTKKCWIKEIAIYSGLENNIVSNILDDLTYDYRLYESSIKKPDITYQPFFYLHSDILALSNALLFLSYAERNIWDLTSIKRPNIQRVLSNRKESLWINKLNIDLEKCGFIIIPRIKYNYNSKESDIDVLLLSRSEQFGLACQLKWLNHPDRIRDIFYTDKELNNGIQQSINSNLWLKSKGVDVQNKLNISSSEIQNYSFESIVISKNTLGSNYIDRRGIPIINERLLKWILINPHNKSLRTLWKVSKECTYMPKKGLHYIDDNLDLNLTFGDIIITAKQMGFKKLRRWDPKKDILF